MSLATWAIVAIGVLAVGVAGRYFIHNLWVRRWQARTESLGALLGVPLEVTMPEAWHVPDTVCAATFTQGHLSFVLRDPAVDQLPAKWQMRASLSVSSVEGHPVGLYWPRRVDLLWPEQGQEIADGFCAYRGKIERPRPLRGSDAEAPTTRALIDWLRPLASHHVAFLGVEDGHLQVRWRVIPKDDVIAGTVQLLEQMARNPPEVSD